MFLHFTQLNSRIRIGTSMTNIFFVEISFQQNHLFITEKCNIKTIQK